MFGRLFLKSEDLNVTEPEERHLVGQMGTMEHDKPTRYILDLTLPKRPDGKFAIAQMEITYDVGTGKRETTGQIPLEVQYAAQQGYVNAEVVKHIDDVQIFEMNKDLQKAIAANDASKVEQVAKNIEKKGELMGPRAAKKTMLAKAVLDELGHGGRVSKKTQLAVDDAAHGGRVRNVDCLSVFARLGVCIVTVYWLIHRGGPAPAGGLIVQRCRRIAYS